MTPIMQCVYEVRDRGKLVHARLVSSGYDGYRLENVEDGTSVCVANGRRLRRMVSAPPGSRVFAQYEVSPGCYQYAVATAVMPAKYHLRKAFQDRGAYITGGTGIQWMYRMTSGALAWGQLFTDIRTRCLGLMPKSLTLGLSFEPSDYRRVHHFTMHPNGQIEVWLGKSATYFGGGPVTLNDDMREILAYAV